MGNVGYYWKLAGQILFYYLWSILLTFFNKWAFRTFHFPLTISFFHMCIVFHVVWLYRLVTKRDCEKDHLSWGCYIKRVFPTAVAAALDISLSNWSFVFITVSLYTMSKSTCIIFILIFAILFKLEQPRVSSVFVILLIATGLFLFTYKSTTFNLFGFILVMAASFFGGLRWVTAQMVLQRDGLKLSNPLDFVYYLEPLMAGSLLPLAIGIEGEDMALSPDFILADSHQMLHIFFIVGGGSSLALMLTFSEYLLLSNTSSITLSVCGIIKEIVILTLSTTIGGDPLSNINIMGLIVCLLGIALHVYLKHRRLQKEAAEEQDKEDHASLLTSGSNENLSVTSQT